MYKTKDSSDIEQRLAVSSDKLALMIGCGKKSAIQIGMKAKARIHIGRRVLWNVNKIQEYLDSVSE